MLRFKLDENVPRRVAELLRGKGFDADTVLDEGLRSSPDEDVLAAACNDRRTLLTLDLDFADLRKYSPAATCGIVVLRPAASELATVLDLVTELLGQLPGRDPRGKLWIVESGRLRERSGI